MKALEVVFFAGAPTVVLAMILVALRRRLRDNWRSIAFLATACLLFFHRIVFFAETISQSDANLLQVQFFSIYREAILGGEVPFWNPYQGAGLANLAHPLSAMFYPLTPLFLCVSVFKALGLFVVGHFFLGGVFALLLGRRLFKSRQAALVFALLYAFNGWAITRAAHQPAIEYLFAYTWLPMAALFFERALDGRGLVVSVAGAGAAVAWMGTACPNLFVYGMGLLAAAGGLRLLYLLVTRRVNALALGVFIVLAGGIFAVALSAVEIGPAVELSSFSTLGRMGEVPHGWRNKALSLWDMTRLYFPYTPGRPFGVYYSPGILAVAAAGFALWAAVRNKTHRPLSAASLVVLLLGTALLHRTPVYDFLQRAPIFARASLIPAGLLFLVLPVVLLAGAGVDAVVGGRRRLLGWGGWAVAAFVFLELFAVFGVYYPARGERRLTYDYRREVADFPHLDRLREMGGAGRLVVLGPPEGQVLAPSYALLARGLSRVNLHVSAFAPDGLTMAVDGILEELPPDGMEVLGVGWVVSNTALAGHAGDVEVAWESAGEHFENSVFYALGNLPGWLSWDRVVRLYRAAESPGIVRVLPGLDGPNGGTADGDEAYTSILDELADLTLNDLDTWTAVSTYTTTPSTVTVELGGAETRRCFFAVTAYPGWRLTADGVEAELTRSAGAFMAAKIPAGTKVLELEMRPTQWTSLLWAAIGAFAFAVAGAVRDIIKAQAVSGNPLRR